MGWTPEWTHGCTWPWDGQQRGPMGAAPCAQPLGPMGAPSSMGWTPARSHHGCSKQCLLLGTHGCILFHWKDTNMDPWVHLAMGWTAAWTHRCSTLCSALGTHGCSLFHGMDTSMEPPLMLQPMFAPWDPWVHPLPLEGHSMDPWVLHPVLGPWDPWLHPLPLEGHSMDPWVLPSMGWTAGWSHHWCSNECLPLGTHGCTLLHWKDTRVDPWVLPLP